MVWAISFMNAGWSIRWMKWTSFLRIILGGDFSHILNMSNIKLMAGGFGLAIDYMRVTYILICFHWI
jgi:hypothetical protein